MAALRIGRHVFTSLESRFFCRVLPVLADKPCSVRYLHLSRQLNTERKYTKEHEWVSMSDQVGTIGISDHAQNLLGDIVYVELPEVGKEVEQHEIFGVVESVKAASDLYSPVTGEVVEVNETLQESPELVNKEPYDNGWIIKIKLSDLTQLDDLMSEEAYAKYVEEAEEDD